MGNPVRSRQWFESIFCPNFVEARLLVLVFFKFGLLPVIVPGAFYTDSMVGKLIVSFDFVDENGCKIVDERYSNTLSTPVHGENVTINDYIDFQLSLEHFMSCYLLDKLSHHLVSHPPVELSLMERHNSEYYKSAQPISELQEGRK